MRSYEPNPVEPVTGLGRFYYAIIDIDGKISFANQKFREYFLLKEEPEGLAIYSFFTEKDARALQQGVRNILHQPGMFEYRTNGKPGVYIHWCLTPVCDKLGRVRHIEFSAPDVLHESRHTKIFKENPLPQWIFDQDSLQILDVNDAAINLYEYSKEQFLQMTVIDLHLADNRLRLMQELQMDNFFDRARKTIHQQQKRSGEIINVELNAISYELGDKRVRQVTVVDITDRIMVQEDLASSRERYKVYIEQSSEAIWRYELKIPIAATAGAQVIIDHCRKYGYLAECNATMAGMYGYELPSQIEGSGLDELMDFGDPNNIAYLTAFIESGFRLIDAESAEKDRYGRNRYFLNNLIGVIEDGFLKRAWGTQRDITERKKSEQTVLESEKRFRHVADAAPVMIWMSDPAGETVYVNDPWIKFTGVDLAGLQELGWQSLVHPDDVEIAIDSYNKTVAQLQPVTVTYRLRDCNGEFRWVLDKAIPRQLNDGSFLGYIGSVIDIHDQKLREQKLRYQATILENVSDIIVITDLEYRVLSLNKAAEQFYGTPSTEMEGRLLGIAANLQYGDTRDEAFAKLHSEGEWKGEVLYKNKNDELKYTLTTVRFLLDEKNNKIGIMSVGRDITDRKLAEEKMKASEVFYRNLIADSLDGLLIIDETGRISFASPRVETILGFTVDEVLGKSAFSFVNPEDLEKTLSSFDKQITYEPGVNAISIRLLQKNGAWLWCRVRGNNLLTNPYINGIVISFHDDTNQRSAREALKESEQRFRSLISDLKLGVVMRDAESRAILCNNALLSLLDCEEHEFIGKTLHEMGLQLKAENDSVMAIEQHPNEIASRTQQPVRDYVIGVYREKRQDYIWLLCNSDPILDEKGNLLSVVSTFTDITERKKIEQKLIDEEIQKQKLITRATIDGQEKERMEIGKELHDNIGQQLTTTKLYLDLAKGTADENTAEMVALASKSVSDVINELRRMSRSLIPPTLGDIGLIESVKELMQPFKKLRTINTCFFHESFNESLIPENLKLSLFRIIQEQLNNIMKYAEASLVMVSLEMNGELVVLEITDDGKGFDPVTVKPGLGLKNIKSRTMIFNGSSQIKTSAGNGCSLMVHIPVDQNQAALAINEYMPSNP